MRTLNWLTSTLLVLTALVPSSWAQTNTPPPVIWNDEFDGSEIDKGKWAFTVGGGGFGNNEMQWYSNKPENAFVQDGLLHIVALKKRTSGWPYTSAKLSSRVSWKYGRIEVRAKVPSGVGSWPAIWMLPDPANYDPALGPVVGGWPNSGEIDIMEHVGFDPTVLVQTFHTGAFNFKIGTQKGVRVTVPNIESAFHVYGLDWGPDRADFLLDGQVVYTFENMHATRQEWPFDAPFYLMLNLAVGGDWGGQQGVDATSMPWTFLVDWVRISGADH